MKKLMIIAMLATLLLFTVPASGSYGRRAYLVSIVDSLHEKNGDEVTSFTVNIAGSTAATIYANRSTTTAATNPIVDSSTATDITTLTDGYVTFWYAGATCDIILSDGTYTKTHSGVTPRNTRLMYDSHLYTAMTEFELLDAESISFGTDDDWVAQSAVAKILTWTPLADNSAFNIGVSGTSLNSDFNVYVGTALGLKVDAGIPSLIWDGGAATINHNSNFNVGINTGTSTGNTTIGSGTSGAIALDTTAGITVNADDSYALTVSAGTIGLGATGGDLTIDATDKSVIIRGTEEAADAILIDADGTAGGVHIDCGTGDITLDSGDDIFLEANTGTGDVISLICTKGTSTSSIVVTSTVGGIDLDSALSTWITSSEETGDAIYIHASGTAGGVDITSGTGDIVLTSTDDIVLTNATAVGDMIQLLNTAGTSVTEDAGAIQLTATAGGIQIQSDGDLDDAVVIRADGGTTAEIMIHNDRGTSANSIQLVSDAGSLDLDAGDNVTIDAADDITLDTADGGISLIADGAANGDITLDSQDDLILTSTGKVTITNTEAVTVSGALTMTGLATLTGINQQVVEVGDETAYDVLAANSGKLHVIPDLTGDLTMDLPAEAAGLYYKFIYVGGAADAQDWIIDSENNTNFFTGGLNTFDDDDTGATPVYSDNSDDSICTVLTPGTGTEVEIWSDGTIWFINGTVVSGTATSVVFSNL